MAAKPVEPAAPAVAEPAKPAVPPLPEPPKPPEAVKSVTDDAAATSAATQQKLTELAADVKQLVAEGKTTEAMQKVESTLAGLKLTPEQQKVIDGFKQQVQDALAKKTADSATKAATDLLKPKP